MNRKKIKVSVCAKVNLSLNILGARENMHALDSVMASVNLTDAITVCERLDSNVNVFFDSPFSVPKVNSVTRAIEALQSEFGLFGIDVFVKKNLPLSGGLGGSSADAAGAIVAIDKVFNFGLSGLRMNVVASSVGSDVAYMLQGGFARVLGVGERVEKIFTKQEFFLCIVKPQAGVDTAVCYKNFDMQNKTKRLELCDNNLLVSLLEKGDKKEAQKLFSNALTSSACVVLPQIISVIGALQNTNAEKVIMSGSGSCVIGFYQDFLSAQVAERVMLASGLWAMATTTMPCGIIID